MAEKNQEEINNGIDNTYQAGSSFYDFVYSYAAKALPEAEAAVIEGAAEITSGIAGVGGIVIGALEDSADRLNGAARGAVQSLGAVAGAEGGAEFGAGLGFIAGAIFPGAGFITVPLRSGIGAVAGGFVGMKAATKVYNDSPLNTDPSETPPSTPQPNSPPSDSLPPAVAPNPGDNIPQSSPPDQAPGSGDGPSPAPGGDGNPGPLSGPAPTPVPVIVGPSEPGEVPNNGQLVDPDLPPGPGSMSTNGQISSDSLIAVPDGSIGT